jgi:uncharacterized protein
MTAQTPTHRDSSELRWLLDRLVDQVPGVDLALVVSADGLLLSRSRDMTREFAEHLSAMCSGLSSLARSGARHCDRGAVRQTIVEMHDGFLLVAAAGQETNLAVLTGADVDIGIVAYEMQVLAHRVGKSLGARPRIRTGPAKWVAGPRP